MRILFLTILFLSVLNIYCKQRGSAAPSIQRTPLKDTLNDSLAVAANTNFLDTVLYNQKVQELIQKSSSKWPVKAPYPLPGAILPFKRIVAFYGNFYSAGMGILGSLPPDKMLEKLKKETEQWAKADTTTPVLPALHYIAVTAQGSGGSGSKYRLRMPFEQIDKALKLARSVNAILFLDIQVGHSTLQQEIPLLQKYLALPDVHLAIDPEFSMKNGKVPSTSIGTFDAADINYASGYLAELVKKDSLPPKILIVHRFTYGMITNYKQIITRPEVQIVINMDGFGSPAKKIDTYKGSVASQPVQFTGFKLFYKQDGKLMKPGEVLKLNPRPVYIQYQ
jgi:hypothetical protein